MASKEFADKVVLITGAGSGIGKASALRFASLGATLALNDINEESLEITSKECKDINGIQHLAMVGSVTDDLFVERFVAEVINKFGHLDVLVNNAGLGRQDSLSKPDLMKDYDFVMSLNVRAVLKFCQVATPHLERSKGNIVNVSSIVSFLQNEGMLVYSISKAALTKITRMLAMELGPRGIRVNEVNPGFTETGIWRAFGYDQTQQDQIMAKGVQLNPLNKTTNPDDIAKVITHLASEQQAALTTGLSYVADGGLCCKNVSG